MKKTERIAVIGVLAAVGAILSYIESVLSFSLGIPGIKLGLANISVLIALYIYGALPALSVSLIRILVVGLMFGNVFSILFSMAGAMVSFIIMVLFKKIDKFSIIGVSAVGGIAHNLGQIAVALFVVDNYSVMYYLPPLYIAGIMTGIVIGTIARLSLKYMPKRI